jgi:hypothetical protein
MQPTVNLAHVIGIFNTSYSVYSYVGVADLELTRPDASREPRLRSPFMATSTYPLGLDAALIKTWTVPGSRNFAKPMT